MLFNWEEQTFKWFTNASKYAGYDKGMAKLLMPYLEGCKTLCDIGCGMAFADLKWCHTLMRSPALIFHLTL